MERPRAVEAQPGKPWSTPCPPALTPMQSSLGSRQQQNPVWEPADPVMSLETPLLPSLILCGF